MLAGNQKRKSVPKEAAQSTVCADDAPTRAAVTEQSGTRREAGKQHVKSKALKRVKLRTAEGLRTKLPWTEVIIRRQTGRTESGHPN